MIRGRAERQTLLEAALTRHPAWVLSGSLCGWGDCFITRFDLVVFMWLAPAIRLARLRRREAKRFGPAAIAPGGPLHDKVESFLAWAARYDDGEAVERSRTLHEAWLARLPCPVVRLMTTATVDEHVAAVARQLVAP